jgi:ABC-type sulfate transport system substrate-binding protein
VAKQIINLGSSPNKGNGDPLRVAFAKINANFDELYTATTAGSVYIGDVIGSVFADDSTLIIDGITGEVVGYISINTLKEIVAQSTDFNDFKIRISNL